MQVLIQSRYQAWCPTRRLWTHQGLNQVRAISFWTTIIRCCTIMMMIKVASFTLVLVLKWLLVLITVVVIVDVLVRVIALHSKWVVAILDVLGVQKHIWVGCVARVRLLIRDYSIVCIVCCLGSSQVLHRSRAECWASWSFIIAIILRIIGDLVFWAKTAWTLSMLLLLIDLSLILWCLILGACSQNLGKTT